MRIGQIDAPEPLLEAQGSGNLVVFAGAGVSMSPPSNHPNFDRLAEQVAAGSALSNEREEPPDRYLGRLENRGVQVHQRTRGILGDPSSRANQLHHDLLGLFNTESMVRLVTTNFDPHFTTASREMFEDGVAIFHAPALPLGGRFNGIVYLHGSVEQDPQELVLTDRDFGRAYLTEGWARRFLQAMFERYTVLFVGYSHDDVVTSYLARGLPPETRGQRYALIREDEDPAKWNLLGISPITYPLAGSSGHEALGQSVARWVENSRMGVLDHEQKIRRLVQLPPSLEPEKADYMADALRDPAKALFFTRHARGLDWLRWANGQPAFDEMFASATPSGEISKILARWFAQHFACEHPGEALSLVRRRGSRLSPVLWEELATSIASKLQTDARPGAETVAWWVTVLLSTPYPGGPPDSLAYLLEGCRQREDEPTAILLFEHLTAPCSKLDRGFALEGERVGQQIEIAGDTYWMRESWNTIFRPNLVRFAERLEPILIGHLQRSHLLLRSTGEAGMDWDPLNAGRTAIEAHEQDFGDTGIDLLVDAARGLLEWIVEHTPENVQRTIEAWFAHDVPLLKRLAIYGVAESSVLSAEEKLEWVLQKELLYAYGFKHEVFRLLADAYPRATDVSQKALLNRAGQGRARQPDALSLLHRRRLDPTERPALTRLVRRGAESGASLARLSHLGKLERGFTARPNAALRAYVPACGGAAAKAAASVHQAPSEHRCIWSGQSGRGRMAQQVPWCCRTGRPSEFSFRYGLHLKAAGRRRDSGSLG